MVGCYMRCFLYRQAVRVKEFGERMGHIRLFTIPIFRPFCGSVINLGLAIRKYL
jgi:hypothetical protein